MAEIDRLDSPLRGTGQSFRDQVDRYHAVTEMIGDARGHVTDRAQAQDGHGSAVGNVRVGD